MRITKAIYQGETAWVVCVTEYSRVYAYLWETNQFHYFHALDIDYHWDMDMEYVEIEPAEAIALINSGVGRLDSSKAYVAERLIASEKSLRAEEVLGEAAASIRRDEADPFDA